MTSHHPTNIKTKDCPYDLYPEDSRLVAFPIFRPAMYEFYKDAERCFWTPGEVQTHQDATDFDTKLTAGEQRFVKHVLAFFAASDGIVNLNLVERFKNEVGMLEAGYFYDFQVMMENIHAQMYSIILDVVIVDQREKTRLLNAVDTIPVITRMSDYMFACIRSTEGFATRVLRMACVEGLFFTGCFCAIYWLCRRGIMPGLAHLNELIARDEALHAAFALHLYTIISPEYKLSTQEIHAIFTEAVGVAQEFIADALPSGLTEMNADMMGDYIKCQADNLLVLIDTPPLYNVKHGFGFMEQINLTNRTNFFERMVSEYSKVDASDQEDFETTDDF